VWNISKFLKPRFYFLHYSGYRFIANSEHSSQSLFHRIPPVYIKVPKIFKSSKNVYYPVHLCFPCGHFCPEHITEDPPPTKSIQELFKLSNIFKRDTGSFQTKNISWEVTTEVIVKLLPYVLVTAPEAKFCPHMIKAQKLKQYSMEIR